MYSLRDVKHGMRDTKIFVIGALFIVLSLILVPHAMGSPDDINRDGYPDLMFPDSFMGGTTIYWGDNDTPCATNTAFSHDSAANIAIADLNNDSYQDIIYSLYNAENKIYWGDAANSYSSSMAFGNTNSVDSSVADINKDGYLDIVGSGRGATDNSFICWGDSNASYSAISEIGGATSMDTSTIADINKDGYLDIVFSAYDWAANSVIYWGDAGNSYSSKTDLASSPGANGSSIADLNNDGYLDIVFASKSNNTNSVICWGDAANSYSETTELATGDTSGNSIADLNNDGYLDIVFSQGASSSIYWGDASASYSSKTDLSTGSTYGTAVADFNKDSYLDIAFSRCFDPSRIYWGDATASYSSTTDLEQHYDWGIAAAGSCIPGSDSFFGNVIPLWETQGGYGLEVVSSAEYQAIWTTYHLLNEGALTMAAADIAELTQFYFDKKSGQSQVETVTVSGIEWSYFSDAIPEKSYGDSWYEAGTDTYYFYLGSGLQGGGGEGGGVPELPAATMPFIVTICAFACISVRTRCRN
ncbi:MAG: VCBS repeat-containing protein [Candidatus Omnitrophica bacterium]|nr:VCBS repeat-containing protein [Candidatus Omnitrophota bacterium]